MQTLKVIFGRARPEDILVTLDSGSFPSGHVANAATVVTALALITWRLWVVIVGSVYVVLMALSRTYLGAHWVSDTVGGLLIGAGIAIVVWAPFAYRIYERKTRLRRGSLLTGLKGGRRKQCQRQCTMSPGSPGSRSRRFPTL